MISSFDMLCKANTSRERERKNNIDEKIRKRLIKILMKIISADANEVISWGRNVSLNEGKNDFKMGKDIALSVSSIKMKISDNTLDADIKLVDKLKAIELLSKLLVGEESADEGGIISINYDYKSTQRADE